MTYDLRNDYEIKFPLIHFWNLLSVQVHTICSLDEFKTFVLENFNTESKILYCYGQRWGNVHHAWMRIGV